MMTPEEFYKQLSAIDNAQIMTVPQIPIAVNWQDGMAANGE